MIGRALALLVLAAIPVTVVADDMRYAFYQADRLEYQSGEDATVWDLQGWYGGDLNKLWWKLEGKEADDNKNIAQLLYSRAISPWFDVQTGIQYQHSDAFEDVAVIAGIQGMAPYGFELDIAVFFTDDSETGFRAEIERDYYLNQKIVLQPRLEWSDSSRDEDKVEFGMRLRYEFSRQFAPYVGVSWASESEEASALAGLRFWF